MHAYGLAVDLNVVENPYVGCGQTRNRASLPYRDRSRHRRGMVTLPLDRVGLGRSLGGLDEGLHALLVHRALARGFCPPLSLNETAQITGPRRLVPTTIRKSPLFGFHAGGG